MMLCQGIELELQFNSNKFEAKRVILSLILYKYYVIFSLTLTSSSPLNAVSHASQPFHSIVMSYLDYDQRYVFIE